MIILEHGSYQTIATKDSKEPYSSSDYSDIPMRPFAYDILHNEGSIGS